MSWNAFSFLFQSVVLLRLHQAHFSPVIFVHFCAYYLQMPWNAFLFCFNLWSYCACARFISRQSSLFIFARISKCPEMPSFLCFNLWSYCACARLISCQSSFFIFLRIFANDLTCLPFLIQSVVLLRMRQGHFSPVVFVHFCAYLQLLFYVSFCDLTAHAPGSFREFPWRRRSTASHIMLRTRLFILPRRLRS